jgi:hypothetical protein
VESCKGSESDGDLQGVNPNRKRNMCIRYQRCASALIVARTVVGQIHRRRVSIAIVRSPPPHHPLLPPPVSALRPHVVHPLPHAYKHAQTLHNRRNLLAAASIRCPLPLFASLSSRHTADASIIRQFIFAVAASTAGPRAVSRSSRPPARASPSPSAPPPPPAARRRPVMRLRPRHRCALPACVRARFVRPCAWVQGVG